MIDIKVPSPGESISEVEIGSWMVESGSIVLKDQEVVLLESEKASLAVNAPEGGRIEILVEPGTRVAVGSVIARIDPAAVAGDIPLAKPQPAKMEEPGKGKAAPMADYTPTAKVTPLALKTMEEKGLSLAEVLEGLRRITKQDVVVAADALKADRSASAPAPPVARTERNEERKRISLLRQKLSERLVAVKNETAMLTTFNEVDMSAVIDLRNRHKKVFEEKHGVKLGFMSFFTLAASRALVAFPQVNSQFDGDEIITFGYTDIGIAVQTPKGLMVPVIRNTNLLSLAQIELAISATAQKARDNRITLDDLQGGTFSITNGGVFGSLLSTPILNPPQPAILGMHNIVERPVALAGQVVIRPMMYLALSYDHRVIDGKDSVGFLKMIRELIESPLNLLDPGGNAERGLLGL
ncbi:MAG: 2-oxoglutarate dehydrogenase complex dihydrolipoyllysine-residue succinyltransferase [Bacteroidales bacterium]